MPRPLHKRIRFWLGVGAIALNIGLVASGAITLKEGASRTAEEIGYLLATTLGAGYSIAHARSSAEQDRQVHTDTRQLKAMLLRTELELHKLRRDYERNGTADVGRAEGKQGRADARGRGVQGQATRGEG